MSVISGQICPICKTPIYNNENACVCAICGTPHHKSCWNGNRGCSVHGCGSNFAKGAEQYGEQNRNTNFNQISVNTAFSQNTDNNNLCSLSGYCTKCGYSNNSDAIYCQQCGHLIPRVSKDEPNVRNSNQYNNSNIYSNYNNNFHNNGVDVTYFVYADVGKRLVARWIDFFIFGVIGSINGVIFIFFQIDNAIGIVVDLVILWLYFALFECSSFQATPGKMAFGIIVTDVFGQRISFMRATVRFFGKLLSRITFSIGFIMACFTEKKQALHDMLSRCIIIDKNSRY